MMKKIVNISFIRKLLPQQSRKEVHDYWKSPPDSQYNSPEAYLKSNTKNTQILVDIVNQYFNDKNINILELGSNVGRNLNRLYQDGFKNLNAIELNSDAIRLMEKSFPKTFSSTKIFECAIEDKIKEFTDKEFDLVFSMAVLMHIHRDSEWIFEHIVRITKRYLIIMEHEKGVARKNFPRNYKTIFEKLGLKQIDSFNLDKGYTCRIFSRETPYLHM